MKEKLDKLTFKPNANWILLPDPTNTKTESGIILSEEAARKSATNILTAITCGPDCKYVKEGDTIMIDPRTDAIRAEIEGTEYLLVQEFQILGVF